MREARGPAWTDWLRARGRRALRHRHPLARPPLRDAGAMRATSSPATPRSTRRSRPARAAVDGRPLARRGGLDADPYVYADAGRARIAVVDYGCKRSILRRLAGAGAASPSSRTTRRRRAGPLRRRAALERPGRPGAAGRGDGSSRSCSAGCRCSGSASATSCSPSPRATGRQAAFGHRGANHPVLERSSGRVLVTSQNHGFAVDASEAPEATHVSLYDGTVEGLEFPELARGPSSSIRKPGRARTTRGPDRRVGGGGARCPVGAT